MFNIITTSGRRKTLAVPRFTRSWTNTCCCFHFVATRHCSPCLFGTTVGRRGNSVLVGRSVLQDHRTLFAKRSDLCVWLKASLAQIDRVNRGVAAWFLAALAGFCLLRLMFGAANDLLSRPLTSGGLNGEVQQWLMLFFAFYFEHVFPDEFWKLKSPRFSSATSTKRTSFSAVEGIGIDISCRVLPTEVATSMWKCSIVQCCGHSHRGGGC